MRAPPSILDLFRIGIGPSSSHTVGPMRAARRFAAQLEAAGQLEHVTRLRISLHGSLGLTGRGHGADRAVLAGLEGVEPENAEPKSIVERAERISRSGKLRLLGRFPIAFDPSADLAFVATALPEHPNGMRFEALSWDGGRLRENVYLSLGGGFIAEVEETASIAAEAGPPQLPHPFRSSAELLQLARERGKPIWRLVFENECVGRSPAELRDALLMRWTIMADCIERGCANTGRLPGSLKLERRAPALARRLVRHIEAHRDDGLAALDWVNVFALAVAEENAAGGRIVTAPTNGAAGILPAVLAYYRHFRDGDEDGTVRFLLTAGAVGLLFKQNASISGAEVGCQGEVGVACSMAAAGLTAALAGSDAQVENAAEIAMEHNLGLTCDPVGGRVQVPCIERNAMGAVKALNASRLALAHEGRHRVSLDQVIATMRETGADMRSQYKETSRGGLAVHVPEC